VEIAKITGFVASTSLLGMSTILGIAIVGESPRLTELVALPGWFGPFLGVILLLLPVGWLVLAGLKVGRLSWRGHSLSVPTLPLAAGQIVVALADNALAAMALYIVMPDHAAFGPLGFWGFLSLQIR